MTVRYFIALVGFFFTIIVALLADLQGGVRSPYVLVEMGVGMMVGLIIMFDLDLKVRDFFRGMGQLRVDRV